MILLILLLFIVCMLVLVGLTIRAMLRAADKASRERE